MYRKSMMTVLALVSCMGIMTACGGSGSGSGGAGGSLASGEIAQKEFISITQNDSREACEVLKLTSAAASAFIDPIVSVEVKTITCADYGRSDSKCHVATYDEDIGDIACVIGHDGLR